MHPRTEPILEELRRNRAAFEQFCLSLAAEELSTSVPGSPWTVHGYIAHLCTIDSLISPWFSAMAGITGVPAPEVEPPRPFDIDDWNEAIVKRRESRSLQDLLDEAAAHRADYERALAAMTDAQLDSMVPFGGDRKVVDLPATTVRLEDLLWAIALHEPMHVQQDILRALPARAGDAALSAWLAAADISRIPGEITARRT